MARPCTLAVFTKNRVNPAYAAARLAADRVAGAAGARTVHYVPETPDDVGQQKVLVEQALAAAPDAVVFVPVDDRLMVPDLARFAAAGIPVVTCINRIAGKVVSFVGSDDIAVGYSAARALIDGLGGKGRIAAIEGTPAAPTSRDRTIGLHKALAETSTIELVGSGIGFFEQRTARTIMERLLDEEPLIEGVWTSNDVMAFGVLEALAAARRTAKVVGVNGLPEAIDHVERGTMLASVDFSAFNIAGIAAQAALRHLQDQPVPTTITVPAALIDRNNCQRWKVPFAARPLPDWEEVVGSRRPV